MSRPFSGSGQPVGLVDKSIWALSGSTARLAQTRLLDRIVILEFERIRDHLSIKTRDGPCRQSGGVAGGLTRGVTDEPREVHGAVARVPSGRADDRDAGKPPAAGARTSAEGPDGRRSGAGLEPDPPLGRRACARGRDGRADHRQAAQGVGRCAALHGPGPRPRAGRGGEAREEGGRQFRAGGAHPDGAGHGRLEGQGRAGCGCGDGAEAECGDQRHPQGAHRRHGLGRGRL